MPETGGLIQLVTPLGTLNLNTYTDQNFYKVDDFQLSRDMRQPIDNAPQRDGAILGASFYRGPIHAMIKGTIYASDLPTRANLMDNLCGYLASITNASGTLLWTPFGKAARQISCRLLDYPSVDDGDLFKSFSFSVISEDSVAYSQMLYSQDSAALQVGSAGTTWQFGTATPTTTWQLGTPSTTTWTFGTDPGGGTATIINSGNAESWPIIRLYGNAVAPKITHVQSGKSISLPTLTIQAGSYAEIDMKKQTILLNGNTALTLLSFLDTANSQFFTLSPGSQTIRMTASSFDSSAKATVIWRDAWA